MDSKSDLFDLKKEKQELDNFLSTIAGSDMPLSAPVKGAAPAKESLPAEKKPVSEIAKPEAPKPRPLASAPKPEEAFTKPASQEKPAPRIDEIKLIKPVEEAVIKPKITSSFLPDTEEKKIEPPPKTVSFQERKAPETPRVSKPSEPESIGKEVKVEPMPPEEKTMTVDFEKEQKALEEAIYEPAPAEKKTGKGKQTGLLVLLVVVLLGGAVWMYSGQVINTLKSIPGIKNLISVEKDVNLINVRQRLVENKKIGKSIRVIEGIAANASSQTISNIKIMATLQDAGGAELTSTEAFAGNILIDEKLENLDANAIKTILQTARGAQDKIPPKGQIPFMIVFTSEPAGVFRMSVTPVDFTKN